MLSVQLDKLHSMVFVPKEAQGLDQFSVILHPEKDKDLYLAVKGWFFEIYNSAGLTSCSEFKHAVGSFVGCFPSSMVSLNEDGAVQFDFKTDAVILENTIITEDGCFVVTEKIKMQNSYGKSIFPVPGVVQMAFYSMDFIVEDKG